MVKLIAVLLGISVSDAEMFCKKVNIIAVERYGFIRGRPFRVAPKKIYSVIRSLDGKITPDRVIDKLGQWVQSKQNKPFTSAFSDGQTRLPGHAPPTRIERVYQGGLVGVGGKKRKK